MFLVFGYEVASSGLSNGLSGEQNIKLPRLLTLLSRTRQLWLPMHANPCYEPNVDWVSAPSYRPAVAQPISHLSHFGAEASHVEMKQRQTGHKNSLTGPHRVQASPSRSLSVAKASPRELQHMVLTGDLF